MKFTIAIISLATLLLAGCGDDDQGQRKAQYRSCINNLKQIGLAFQMWAGDHNGQLPFNISTNAGGILELCAPDKDGFDTNAILYLRNMNGPDELRSPLLLVCPEDTLKHPAADLNKLEPENITYRFRSGFTSSPTNQPEIIAVCPIDGNVLYSDGAVQGKK